MVLDQGLFYSLNNRRNAALQMFQSLRRDTLMWTSVLIWDNSHPKFHSGASLTTPNCGLGIIPNPRYAQVSCSQHRGCPIFSNSGTAVRKLQHLAAKHPEIVAPWVEATREDTDNDTLSLWSHVTDHDAEVPSWQAPTSCGPTAQTVTTPSRTYGSNFYLNHQGVSVYKPTRGSDLPIRVRPSSSHPY